jgi:uncharacterized protein (DUF58 family)
LGALKVGVIAAVLFVVAVVNDWSTPDRLIITLVAVLVLTWIWSRLSLQRLGLARGLSLDRVRAGEWVTEEFTMTNHTVLPKLWVEIRDLSTLPGHRAGRVVRLGSRGSATWTASTRCERRGRYRLGPIALASGDPLGMFELRKLIPATHELVVYPPQVDISDVPLPMASMSGGQARNANAALATQTIAGIREYAVGDPLNRIAWNATARLGRMMVKEFDPDPTSDIWVLLDLGDPETHGDPAEPTGPAGVGPSFDEAIEYAIAVAGSLAELCLGAGRKVGMIVNRAIPIRLDADGSQRQWFRIFETLAVASSFGHRSLFEAIQADSQRFSRNAGLIVVTPNSARDWVPAAGALVQRHVPVTAVVISDRAHDARAEVDLLLEDLATSHVATVRLSPGERFAATAGNQFAGANVD